MSLTLILVLIGSLTFFGYVIFLVSTSKPKVGNDSEIEKDLDVINKMKEIFELINSKFNKVKIFEWSEDVEGSLRKEPDYKTRRAYISKYLKTKQL